MKLELDITGSISRLSEIKHRRLHHHPRLSGFLHYIVPNMKNNHVTMSYITTTTKNGNNKLIGWAYIRTRIPGIEYDAGSFVKESYRGKGYAKSALNSLTEYIKKIYNPIIEIKASAGTLSILNQMKQSYFKITELTWDELENPTDISSIRKGMGNLALRS